MLDLKKIQADLLKIGYKVYLTKINGVEYLRGGVDNNSANYLDVEIWIKIVNSFYVFIDITNQKAMEKEFSNEGELVTFIRTKYPI